MRLTMGPRPANVRLTLAVAALSASLAACATARGSGQTLAPAATDVETTIYLIGDAGVPDPRGEPVFTAITADALERRTDRLIVFLGDNIYPRVMPAPESRDRAEAERRLSAQIAVGAATGADVVFIPGNHDWDYAGQGRRAHLLRSHDFIRDAGVAGVRFMPAEACPGPDVVDVGRHIRLIVLDTQWWLFPEPVEAVPPTCAHRDRDSVLAALRQALGSAGDREVIVAAHHPLMTGGPHGGYFNLRQHLFPLTEKWSWAWVPLPVIGSLYPFARRSGISEQDLSGALYRSMSRALEDVLDDSPPLLYAAGHEHSLQVSTGESMRYHVVSGAGNYEHTTPVSARDGTLYASSRSGYVRLDVQADGAIRLGVVAVDEDGGREEVFAIMLQ